MNKKNKKFFENIRKIVTYVNNCSKNLGYCALKKMVYLNLVCMFAVNGLLKLNFSY